MKKSKVPKKRKQGYQMIKCVNPSYWDIDNTLVMWGGATKPAPGLVKMVCQGRVFYLKPHKKHIAQLKAHWLRGMTNIAWSQGGHQWCNAVIRSLNLTKYFAVSLEKPKWYWDDKEAAEFMGKADFIKDE